eukprot:c53153_g1_i1 orf=33-221(-)
MCVGANAQSCAYTRNVICVHTLRFIHVHMSTSKCVNIYVLCITYIEDGMEEKHFQKACVQCL